MISERFIFLLVRKQRQSLELILFPPEGRTLNYVFVKLSHMKRYVQFHHLLHWIVHIIHQSPTRTANGLNVEIQPHLNINRLCSFYVIFFFILYGKYFIHGIILWGYGVLNTL